MLEIISNGHDKNSPAWITNKPGTIEDLKEALREYTLDPTFEDCGNFINYNPKWLKKEDTEKYKDCVRFFGNFLTLSHVFNIITDDAKLINELEELIKNNKETSSYIEAREEYIKREEDRKKHLNYKISR